MRLAVVGIVHRQLIKRHLQREAAALGLFRAGADQATKPHPRNARKHSAAQIDQRCASIAAHGVVKPAVLDEDGTVLSEGPCANHAPSRGHSMPLPGVLHCARALA
jgi:hypothetical protein